MGFGACWGQQSLLYLTLSSLVRQQREQSRWFQWASHYDSMDRSKQEQIPFGKVRRWTTSPSIRIRNEHTSIYAWGNAAKCRPFERRNRRSASGRQYLPSSTEANDRDYAIIVLARVQGADRAWLSQPDDQSRQKSVGTKVPWGSLGVTLQNGKSWCWLWWICWRGGAMRRGLVASTN